MWPDRWSPSIKPLATISRNVQLAWIQFHSLHNSLDSAKRLALGLAAISLLINLISSAVAVLPRYLNMMLSSMSAIKHTLILNAGKKFSPPPKKINPAVFSTSAPHWIVKGFHSRAEAEVHGHPVPSTLLPVSSATT